MDIQKKEDDLKNAPVVTAKNILKKNHQSNRITEAPLALTVVEQRLMYLVINQTAIKNYEENAVGDRLYCFNVADCLKYITTENHHYEIKKALYTLQTKRLCLRNDDECEEYVIAFPYTKFEKRENLFFMQMHRYAVPYFDALLERNFTQIEFEVITKFKSKYTQKLYELLCQYRNSPIKENGKNFYSVSVDDYRRAMGVHEYHISAINKTVKAKFLQYWEFKRRVITPAIAEINRVLNLSEADKIELKEERNFTKGKHTNTITDLIFSYRLPDIAEPKQKGKENLLISATDVKPFPPVSFDIPDDLKVIKDKRNGKNYNIYELIRREEKETRKKIITSLDRYIEIRNDLIKALTAYNKKQGNLKNIAGALVGIIRRKYFDEFR